MHLLEDMLLPQSLEGHCSKTVQEILDEAKTYVFHVRTTFFFLLNFPYKLLS